VTGKIAALPSHAAIATGGTRVGEQGFYLAPTVITGVRQDDFDRAGGNLRPGHHRADLR